MQTRSPNQALQTTSAIRTAQPGASFDQISTATSDHDFGPITRETISSKNFLRIAVTVGAMTIGAAIAREVFGK